MNNNIIIKTEDHPSTEELISLMQKDDLGKNKDIEGILRMLKLTKSNNGIRIISLDGPWGSGKTYTVKQIETLLSSKEDLSETVKHINKDLIKESQDAFVPCYYNAWENDYASNPTQSLLLNLNDYLIEKSIIERSETQLLNAIKGLAANTLQKATGLNEEMIEHGKTTAKLTEEVNKNKKLRITISNAISKLSELHNKKVLYIIDDIDRCKPTYAVELLESIKHCFDNEKVVFLVATNITELSNIINGYYGGKLDGSLYLDRIIDLRIGLNTIDIEHYVKSKIIEPNQSIAPILVAKYLNMTMREMNRYLSIINLYSDFINNSHISIRDEARNNCIKHLFLPLFLGYKIKNNNAFSILTRGNGFNYIQSYIESSDEIKAYTAGLLSPNSFKEYQIEAIKTIYNSLINEPKTSYQSLTATSFWEIINLTSRMISF